MADKLDMYVSRRLNIAEVLRKKSVFLLGPRQTGKTKLIVETLPDVQRFSLLDHRTFLWLSQDPSRLRERVTAPVFSSYADNSSLRTK